MKNSIRLIAASLLLFVASCAGGSNFAFAQTALLPNMTKVAPEWVDFKVPTGVTLTAQFGCGAKWSAPFTITGGVTVSNDWSDLKTKYPKSLITGDSTGCATFNGLGELWVQQGTAAVTLTVLSNPNAPLIVPIAGAVTPPVTTPPATTSTTVSLPLGSKSCTWTLTVDANNNPLLTIK